MAKRRAETVTRETANDVGVWGDKAYRDDNYDGPLEVGGEPVDLDALPEFGDDEASNAPAQKPRTR